MENPGDCPDYYPMCGRRKSRRIAIARAGAGDREWCVPMKLLLHAHSPNQPPKNIHSPSWINTRRHPLQPFLL